MPDALYPGTFDPPTRGHLDILQRAAGVFGSVEVAVSAEPPKDTLLSAKERLVLVRRAVEGLSNIEVTSFEGLLVEYAEARDVNLLIRGLRRSGDFDHEYQMAAANRKMVPGLETICFFTASEFDYISSTVVREIYGHGGDISPFVPEVVDDLLRARRETGKIG